MIAAYPVLLTQTDKEVLIEVPDLDILTEGTDIVDAIRMAREAIELIISEYLKDGIEIPGASDLSNITTKGTFADEGKTIVTLVDIDISD